jgi:hypothetical protein
MSKRFHDLANGFDPIYRNCVKLLKLHVHKSHVQHILVQSIPCDCDEGKVNIISLRSLCVEAIEEILENFSAFSVAEVTMKVLNMSH